MTIEQTQVASEVTNQVPNETIKTDIFGIELDLPVEVAKKLIAKRDERTSVFKDLNQKVQVYEKEKSELAKRLEMAEKVKAGAFEEAEKIASQKAEEKLSKFRNKVVDSEITNAFLQHPEFLGKDVLEDAIKLLKMDKSFDLNEEDNTIKSGDKTVEDTVRNWLQGKPAFRKVASATSQPKKFGKAQEQKATGTDALASGLAKFMRGK
jgi:antitoxin component of MazEF toxin-antitoxin module